MPITLPKTGRISSIGSSIRSQDKALILRVLEMYPDPEVREQEIKNISFVYEDLAQTILPQLRRSRLIAANIEIIGKTDDEIMTLWKNNPKQLSVEELLYATTLTDDPAEKERIYQYDGKLSTRLSRME